MRDIVLKSKLALGDAIVLTALLRDIHRCHPGEFRTGVSTNFQRDVWAENPDVTPLRIAAKETTVVGCHYGKQMRAAKNGMRMHFMQGYISYFNSVMGTDVRLTDYRPALYMSEQEAEKPPLRLKKPYWVIVAGGKMDMTTKWWDSNRYQEVVDKLQKDVNFVQLGAKRDWHAQLTGKNLKRLVGGTTARQFLQIIYHSEGVISPITAAMHAAGAFEKPSVVIAGGREAWWWEAYPNSIYLHTIGRLHCCSQVACHRSSTANRGQYPCHDYVQKGDDGNAVAVAKCMHMITSDMVVDAVRTLMDDYKTPATWPPDDLPPVDIEYVDGENAKSLKPYIPHKGKGRGVRPKKFTSRFMKRTRERQKKRAAIALKRKKETPMPSAKVVTPAPKKHIIENPLGDKFTVCVVLYGGAPGNETFKMKNGKTKTYDWLLQRWIDEFLETTPLGRVQLRVATNSVSDKILKTVDGLKDQVDTIVYGPNENRYKYPRLREMFYGEEHPIETEWIVVFDDDTSFRYGPWVPLLEARMQKDPKARCYGEHYIFNLTPRQIKWHKSRYWWKGREGKMRSLGRMRVDFITGGFWAMRFGDIKMINWPDPGLRHNGGDVALGSAMYQQGWTICNCQKVVDIHNMPTRGFREKHPSK